MPETDATLAVTVNGKEEQVPNTVETLSELLESVGYHDREYTVYRLDGGDEVHITGEMFVFDEGDEFVIVPKYVTGG